MALEFHRWCHCGRIVVLGLVKRRAAEREIFCYDPLQLESGSCCVIRVYNRHSVYSHLALPHNYRQALGNQHEVAKSKLDTINTIHRQQKEVVALNAKYT